MSRRCRVCSNASKNEIDESLVKGNCLSSISAVYQITEDALARHRDNHLPAILVKAQEAQEISRADGLLTEIRGLQSITMRVLKRAEEADDCKIVLGAVREARSNLAFLAQIAAQSEQSKQLTDDLEESPEWIALRSAMLKALEPYPEAKSALLEALEDGKTNN
jgi:hypothetical protein